MSKFIQLSVISDRSICYDDAKNKGREDITFNIDKISILSGLHYLVSRKPGDFHTYPYYYVVVDGISYYIDHMISPIDALKQALQS